jgi:hypothetical protein
VSYDFFGGICDFRKLLNHLFVAMVFIPRQRMDMAFPLPLVADADDGSFLQNVVMGDSQLVSGSPREHNVWRCFDVKE